MWEKTLKKFCAVRFCLGVHTIEVRITMPG